MLIAQRPSLAEEQVDDYRSRMELAGITYFE